MHAKAASSLPVLLLACALTSQTQTVVSPLPATASVEGTMANGYPFASYLSARYMQVHSDITGSVKVMQKVAWRRNGGAGPITGTATIDVELFLGDSVDWDQISFLFANNYVGPRMNVVTRKTVSFGPLTGTGTPSPFEIALPLDVPFVYIGNRSIAWEALLHSNVIAGAFTSLDSENGVSATPAATAIGTGCVASGQTSAMSQSVKLGDISGAFEFGGFLQNAPANAPTVLMLGSTNPNQSVPGLCGTVYTNLLATLPIGLTDAAGYIGSSSGGSPIPGGAFGFTFRNTFAGAFITVQAHSLDAGSSQVIKVASSNGASFNVPTPNLTRVLRFSRLWSWDGGVTQPAAVYENISNTSWGVVTQFTY